ncbi:MAG: dTDP-glucose 4,6-dehydratase [Spirulina sp. DLM2.Bin59]|nr:MAG: dTDP-glucose 4,6-dehydratase [Spirulina sp. DLM2.Bin59]
MTSTPSSPPVRGPRHLLVTGGAGFIGSNFVHHWAKTYPQDRIVVLDALTYAGNRKSLAALEGGENFRFVQGDIGDRPLLDQVLATEGINTVAHFAAESHVDRSIIAPDAFIQTNIVGTFTLLEAFRHHWQQGNFGDLPAKKWTFLHVSTDEVYGSLGDRDPTFAETTPYAPNSPYAASKAASDHLVRAYHQTYGIPIVIGHCSNNYGPYQFPEKLIPLTCINILLGKPIPVYGDGKHVRDWLYVEDHCRALEVLIHKGNRGQRYNIGGNNEVRNIELVHIICQLMDDMGVDLPTKPARDLITYVDDRLGHDRRYAINARKMSIQLGWSPSTGIEEGLRQTVRWYLDHRDWWEPLLTREYQEFYQKLYGVV